MWYIIKQTIDDIRVILLTSSKKKCIKQYKILELKAIKEAKELDANESILYYYGYCKKGVLE